MASKKCVVIGASHAGVNFAFSLRKEGWEGDIILYDSDPTLPYHRPPLSKAFLTSDDGIEKYQLKSSESYIKENISLNLGVQIDRIDRDTHNIILQGGSRQQYDKLVIATGARALIPNIPGLNKAKNLFPLRNARDISNIRHALGNSIGKKVVIIGGGYIGLETAASMKKLGADVTVLEREERVLARVTAPEMSIFFQELHAQYGVKIFTNKNVTSIQPRDKNNSIECADGAKYEADLIIVGVGIAINTELAMEAGLEIENGISVDASAKTSDDNIYAIGDCTYHHNPHYDRFIRLESVQNAVDQAKVAAADICGKNPIYNSIPWFWSDQFDIKLQMVGLSNGYDNVVIRKEESDMTKFSVWYFRGEELLAVDGINNAKAYVVGTKFIKERKIVDKKKLQDNSVDFKSIVH
ncbi:MAG: FAD-dependent oxidoreductase [Reichenbachiella sp.]